MSGAASTPVEAFPMIDGQTINIATMAELVGKSIGLSSAGTGYTIFTLNMDHVVKRRVDAKFRDAYARATFVTADGAPIVWLARRQGARLERTTGADVLAPLCEAASGADIPVAFFGSTDESLQGAARQLKARYPQLRIAHMEAPPQGFEAGSHAAIAAADRIARSGARICFVALGAPKQEMFSDRMAQIYPDIGFLGIGAALDFVSGVQSRAPLFFQGHGLEWAWRLAQNPLRLAARYMSCARMLAILILIEPLSHRLARKS